MKKSKTIFGILFLVVGLLTVLEFTCVRGMFTWIIAMGASAVLGLINVVLEAADKKWLYAGLYLLCAVALCMGYAVLLGRGAV